MSNVASLAVADASTAIRDEYGSWKKELYAPANLFGYGSKQAVLPGLAYGHPLALEADPLFVPPSELVREVIAFLQNPGKDGFWLGGFFGAGKTYPVQQVLARLGLPVLAFSLNRRFEFAQLIGSKDFAPVYEADPVDPAKRRVVGSRTVFRPGVLYRAMKYGYVLLINELDRGDPGELVGLNDILETGRLVVLDNGGEVVEPHPNFRLFVTANSGGGGDVLGVMNTVQIMDPALMDRFRFSWADYLPETVELSILEQAAPDLKATPEVLARMVKTANEIRRLFIGQNGAGELSVTMSTRTLIRWAHLTLSFRGMNNAVAYAFRHAFSNRLKGRPEEEEAVVRIMNGVFGVPEDEEAAP